MIDCYYLDEDDTDAAADNCDDNVEDNDHQFAVATTTLPPASRHRIDIILIDEMLPLIMMMIMLKTMITSLLLPLQLGPQQVGNRRWSPLTP